MGKFVPVYSKTTGLKHRVPEHWLDHPVLGKGFRKTPLQRDRDTRTQTTAAATATDKTPSA